MRLSLSRAFLVIRLETDPCLLLLLNVGSFSRFYLLQYNVLGFCQMVLNEVLESD